MAQAEEERKTCNKEGERRSGGQLVDYISFLSMSRKTQKGERLGRKGRGGGRGSEKRRIVSFDLQVIIQKRRLCSKERRLGRKDWEKKGKTDVIGKGGKKGMAKKKNLQCRPCNRRGVAHIRKKKLLFSRGKERGKKIKGGGEHQTSRGTTVSATIRTRKIKTPT